MLYHLLVVDSIVAVLVAWAAYGMLLCYALLRWCVKDPH